MKLFAMPDVSSNTTASISIAVTVVTAIGATVNAVLGVEMQAVLWAMIGGFFGAALGPAMKKWQIATIRYVFASLLSALAASWIERKIDGGTDAGLRNLIAGALSFGFYPLTQSMLRRADWVVGSLLHRLTGALPAPPAAPPPKQPPIGNTPPNDGSAP